EMIKAQLPVDDQAQKHLEQIGFDQFRDLSSVTIAMPPSKDPEAMFVIVEGSFTPEKVHAVAEQVAQDHGDVFKISKVGKYKVFEITPPGANRFYASLLNNNAMVVCASERAVQAAIKRAIGAERPPLKREITSLLQTTSNKQSFSFVATGSALVELSKEAPVANEQALQALKAIEGISAAVTVSKDVQMQLGVATKDAATAKDFAQKAGAGLNIVRFLVAQKAMQDERFQPLADAVKTLRATSEQANLILRAE